MVLTTTISAFATPVDDLRNALISAGVPDEKTGSIIEYFQKVSITQAQADKVIGYIDSIVAKLNGETDISKIPKETRESIKADAAAALEILGLKLNYGTGALADSDNTGVFAASFTSLKVVALSQSVLTLTAASGPTEFTVTDSKGNIIYSDNIDSIAALVKKLNINAIKDAVQVLVEFSNNPDKTKYSPVDGSKMKHTSTNYGIYMVIGLSIAAVAAILFAFNKRRAVLN